MSPARAPSGLPSSVVLDGVDVVPELRPVFQPLVELDSGRPVGYEALIRGSGALRTPGELFAAARATDQLGALDWACREAAVAEVRRAALRHPLSLFVNAEPEAVAPETLERWGSFSDLRCFAEFTERGLLDRPADLVRAVDAVRAQDWGIALDDIGADPASLALMPVLAPDVLKLDRALLHDTGITAGRTVHAVLAQAERTGATVVAEGIETEAERETARSWGVRLGQGWLLGRPGPLPAALETPSLPVGLLRRTLDRARAPGPFAIVNDQVPSRRVGRGAVDALWREVQRQAVQPPGDGLVLACTGRHAVDDAPDATARNGGPGGLLTGLESLAGSVSLVALLATAPPRDSAMRTGTLAPDDPAVDDLDLVVLGPSSALAVVARPAADGDWDVAVTFDRELVVTAAVAMLVRVEAQDEGAGQRSRV